MEIIQSIRGMNDVLPTETPAWQYLEETLFRIIQSYGYQEIRFPLLENTALFKRAIGEVTDIIEKEMYTFPDRNGAHLSLRPEGTAGCVRACIQNNLFYNQTQRLWYHGPMFRYERPQKGRYRQFDQWGVEAYGFSDVDIELEILLMSHRFWKKLGIEKYVSLEINTLGTLEERQTYRTHLIEYFEKNKTLLDEDSIKRLFTNPLRILDTKNPDMQSLVENAPKLFDSLGDDSRNRFQKLIHLLEKSDISFKINYRLVRGLDYYTHTVFEWITSELGAQGTVCAGGRYDALVSQLGGAQTPAFGFGLGPDRLLLLLENKATLSQYLPRTTDIYCIFMGGAAEEKGVFMLEKMRDLVSYKFTTSCGSHSKNQWKKADKSGALLALVLGDNEIAQQTVSIKFLRENKPQIEMQQEQLAAFLENYFNGEKREHLSN